MGEMNSVKEQFYLDFLKEALKDKDIDIRVKSAEILCSLGEESGIQVLRELVEEKTYEELDLSKSALIYKELIGKAYLQARAAASLIQNGNKSVYPALKGAAKQASPHGLEMGVAKDIIMLFAKTAVELNDKLSIPILKEAVNNTKGIDDFEPYTTALWAIAKLGDNFGLEKLKFLHSSEAWKTEASFCSFIAVALYKLGDKSMLRVLKDRLSYPILMDFGNAAFVLGEMGDISVKPTLEKLLQEKKFIDPRRRAIETLGMLGDKSVMPSLEAIVEDENESVRTHITAMGAILKLLRGVTIKHEVPEQKEKKGCFIATAVYGSPLASEVITLQKFRDVILLKTLMGKVFITIYYAISPYLAKLISKYAFLRLVMREFFLTPIVQLSGVIYKKYISRR